MAAPAPKLWWKSRTLWFNLILAAAAAAESGFSLLQPLLPVNAYAVLTFALAVGNAALRVITTTELAMRSAASDAEEPQP